MVSLSSVSMGACEAVSPSLQGSRPPSLRWQRGSTAGGGRANCRAGGALGGVKGRRARDEDDLQIDGSIGKL